MSKTVMDASHWLLMAGIILVWSLAGAGTVFALAPKARAARPGNGLIQSSGAKKIVPCAEALKHAPEVKVGMRESEVLDLLGEPTGKVGNEWVYNFWPCVKPPKAGEQKIIGLGIVFNERIVKEIKYATVDATGPAPKAAMRTA